jgi:hypothetical protein
MLMGVNGLTIEFCNWHGLVARVGDQARVRSDRQCEYNKKRDDAGRVASAAVRAEAWF